MRPMTIEGKRGTYKVEWVQAGWTYAVPQIYEEKGWLFGLWKVKKVIWEGEAISYITANKKHRRDMISWYKKAVHEYEDYLDSWENG